MLSRPSMMMTSLETLKISFALDIKLFEESVSRDIGTEGRSSQDSYSQQVEFRSSIHGPLQCFQAVDVPFCRSAAPFILESGGHGRVVAFQSCRHTLHLPNSALRHSFHPIRECFPISLLEDAVEFPRKDLRLGDLRRHF